MKASKEYLKAKRIASISPRRRASRDAYNRSARDIVRLGRAMGHYCPVVWALAGVTVLVECIHHMRGKGCEALRHDRRGWLMVSMTGHSMIDFHRAEARKRGWLCPLGKWNTPFKPDESPMPGSVADLCEKGLLHTQPKKYEH